MSTTTPLARLADARPAAADRTGQLVTLAERHALLDSIVATGEAPASVAVTPGLRPRRRRLRLAAPAVAGAVVVALVWAGGPSGPQPSPPAPTRPSAGAAAVPLDRVRLAVAAADDLVLHMRSDFGNGVLWEAWHDSAGRRSRTRSTTPAGAPLYDHELAHGDEGATVRVVSYRDRAWWTHATPSERGDAGPGHGLSAADIRAQLQDGTLEEVGPEKLDGNDVLHLRWMPQAKPGFVTVPGDLWVDATTFLPIRSVTRWGADGDKAMRSDYEWLPRTPAVLAQLTAPVPAGFAHRAAAPEDPPGAAGVG